MNVERHSVVVQVSSEVLADAVEMRSAILRWTESTPEERAQRYAEIRQQRVDERAAAERKPLTVEALLDKMGWSREYAEHLVQPYCECYDGMDGWEYCSHAYDEGLVG